MYKLSLIQKYSLICHLTQNSLCILKVNIHRSAAVVPVYLYDHLSAGEVIHNIYTIQKTQITFLDFRYFAYNIYIIVSRRVLIINENVH